MKPILLLAAPQEGRPACEWSHVELRRGPGGRVDAATYSTVIVINEGDAGTIHRLRRALALRDRHRDLRVGVLTRLDGSVRAAPAAVAVATAPAAGLQALGPELRVELAGEVLSLEYQLA